MPTNTTTTKTNDTTTHNPLNTNTNTSTHNPQPITYTHLTLFPPPHAHLAVDQDALVFGFGIFEKGQRLGEELLDVGLGVVVEGALQVLCGKKKENWRVEV